MCVVYFVKTIIVCRNIEEVICIYMSIEIFVEYKDTIRLHSRYAHIGEICHMSVLIGRTIFSTG